LFDESHENKLEYTQIYSGYTQLVDELLTAEFSELALTADQVERFCGKCFSGQKQLSGSLKVWMQSINDFMVFKQIMIDRRLEQWQHVALSCDAMHVQDRDPTQHDIVSEPQSLVGSRVQTNACVTDSMHEYGTEHEHIFAEGARCSPVDPDSVFAGESRPITLLEQRWAGVTELPNAKATVGSLDENMAIVHGGKQFYLYKARSHLNEPTPKMEPVNFAVSPEPWLSERLAAAASPQELLASAQHGRTVPTEEELQQRADYWRSQGHLLRRASGSAGDHNITPPSYPKLYQRNGAHLASELSRPVDAARHASPPVDMSAVRQALTRQLRSTFDSS